MLAWTIYITFFGVLVLMLLPRDNAKLARIVALLTAIAGCAIAFVGAIQQVQQTNPGDVTTIKKIEWIHSIGANYFLAADGISLMLVVLTGLAAVSGILFSWNIEKRTKEFFAFFLALIGGVYGVFLSFDVLLLFVFYELTIIPKYFLIARWGSTRKEYGAMKLAIYSFVGSHLVLIGLIAAWVVAKGQLGHASLDLIELSKVSFPVAFQYWVFPLVFIGFAILAVCGRFTPGRRPGTSPRRPPVRCCSPAW
jgi:NADH-quinone oxidoreductase subunit M